MKNYSSNPSPPVSATAVVPATCPACQATSIVTAAKSPDVDSYWRCTKCGEIWNAARLRPNRYGGTRWQ